MMRIVNIYQPLWEVIKLVLSLLITVMKMSLWQRVRIVVWSSTESLWNITTIVHQASLEKRITIVLLVIGPHKIVKIILP